jgi:hypothetical protein
VRSGPSRDTGSGNGEEHHGNDDELHTCSTVGAYPGVRVSLVEPSLTLTKELESRTESVECASVV